MAVRRPGLSVTSWSRQRGIDAVSSSGPRPPLADVHRWEDEFLPSRPPGRRVGPAVAFPTDNGLIGDAAQAGPLWTRPGQEPGRDFNLILRRPRPTAQWSGILASALVYQFGLVELLQSLRFFRGPFSGSSRHSAGSRGAAATAPPLCRRDLQLPACRVAVPLRRLCGLFGPAAVYSPDYGGDLGRDTRLKPFQQQYRPPDSDGPRSPPEPPSPMTFKTMMGTL